MYFIEVTKMAKPNEQLSRLQQLETLEQHLAKSLESAGETIFLILCF